MRVSCPFVLLAIFFAESQCAPIDPVSTVTKVLGPHLGATLPAEVLTSLPVANDLLSGHILNKRDLGLPTSGLTHLVSSMPGLSSLPSADSIPVLRSLPLDVVAPVTGAAPLAGAAPVAGAAPGLSSLASMGSIPSPDHIPVTSSIPGHYSLPSTRFVPGFNSLSSTPPLTSLPSTSGVPGLSSVTGLLSHPARPGPHPKRAFGKLSRGGIPSFGSHGSSPSAGAMPGLGSLPSMGSFPGLSKLSSFPSLPGMPSPSNPVPALTSSIPFIGGTPLDDVSGFFENSGLQNPLTGLFGL